MHLDRPASRRHHAFRSATFSRHNTGFPGNGAGAGTAGIATGGAAHPKTGQYGSGIGAHIGYSPYCVPRVIDGIKCVIVSEALRALEPMAWDFVMHFARDNELQVVEACLLPDPAEAPAAP